MIDEMILKKLYQAVPNEKAMLQAVGAIFRSDRVFDKAIQILRRRGLVKYVKGEGWQKKVQ